MTNVNKKMFFFNEGFPYLDILQGFIKFDYDTSVITINVNKFGNGNAQFSVGMGVKKMVCPDPFMGRLSDPNMNRK